MALGSRRLVANVPVHVICDKWVKGLTKYIESTQPRDVRVPGDRAEHNESGLSSHDAPFL